MAQRKTKLSPIELREHALELFTVEEMMSKIIKPKLELLNILIAIRNSYPDVDINEIEALISNTRDECAPYLELGTSKIKCRINKERLASGKAARKAAKSGRDHHLVGQTQADERIVKVKSLH